MIEIEVSGGRRGRVGGDVDPRAWLADVLERLPGHRATRLDELLPWNWRSPAATLAA